MPKVIFATKAEVDFTEIQRTVLNDFGYAVLLDVDKNFDRLFLHISNFPEGCEAARSLGPGVRRGVIYPYSVFYRVDTDERVVILRILHGRRKITRNMLRET